MQITKCLVASYFVPIRKNRHIFFWDKYAYKIRRSGSSYSKMMNLKKMVKDWLTDCPLFKIVLGLVQMIMKRRVSPWRSQIGEWFLSIYFFLGFWLSYDWQGRIFYQFLFSIFFRLHRLLLKQPFFFVQGPFEVLYALEFI